MFIWSLKGLKRQLVESGLSDRQSLPYTIIVLVCVSCAFVAVPQHNLWSIIYGVAFLSTLAGGTLLAYRSNGGATGRDFLPRFFSLIVVCGARWLLFYVLPLVVLAVVIPGTPWVLSFPLDPDRGDMGPYDVVMQLFVVPSLLWWVAVQMRQVAGRSWEPAEQGLGHDGPDLEPLED